MIDEVRSVNVRSQIYDTYVTTGIQSNLACNANNEQASTNRCKAVQIVNKKKRLIVVRYDDKQAVYKRQKQTTHTKYTKRVLSTHFVFYSFEFYHDREHN